MNERLKKGETTENIKRSENERVDSGKRHEVAI